ncbi:VCBS repeat-containing protein [Algibacter agarivorans]|uniref:VCBS repeat-containing protein n=1 Tax=Algibacter agarivorans TaxID=1109741 RepID=A0ABP9G9A7_9FLAO
MSIYRAKTNNVFILLIIGIVFSINVTSCKKDNENYALEKTTNILPSKLFESVSSSLSGITFVNELVETKSYNYFKYNYSYIGGGVATADFNNDGLQDLFFTSNSKENKLYLNKGNFKFDDITSKAGINPPSGFNTGVTVVDINQDGYLDIYLCRGGYQQDNNKFANLLYINNGDLTFTEKAKNYGLADANRTIQATFFDYDNDNDLDVYISNAPDVIGKSKVLNLDEVAENPDTYEQKGSDRLYENDGNGYFNDVSKKAGITYDLGFGLNPQVCDLNNDGWLDIYVCNDFNIPDFTYINNGNGTFTESREQMFKHMSFNSMGSDFTDINNDGLLDLMTLDMNPEDYIRSKTTMAMTSISRFEQMVNSGYHYQYMHNMLQLNNGNGTFSEISKLSGMADTDWSWALLSADFDLDGYNDIYITNGVYRDVMDRDAHNETLKTLRANRRKPTDDDFLKFTKMMPQQKINNFFYKNNGDLTFENTSETWVNATPTFSNGAVYADLDNDGDLDIVVNNINEEASVLKNNAIDTKLGQYLKIKLKGPQKNNNGLGATIKLFQKGGALQTRQLVNTRGFLSSVSNVIHFGVPTDEAIEKIEIHWLDGKYQEIQNVQPNSLLNISYSNATKVPIIQQKKDDETLFTKLKPKYIHQDLYFNDYSLQVLLPHKLSQTGPALAKADVNNDGFDDIYLGGGLGQAGQLLLGNTNGTLKDKNIPVFNQDKMFEDQGATFFDADNDGDKDLYVVSGSYELHNNQKLLQDRLYINNGNGQFTRSKGVLPKLTSSGSVVAPSDFDSDGDLDLFVGGRVIPGNYPLPAVSYILKNNNGSFSIETPMVAPELEKIGLVTSAVWIDLNNDNSQDLLVTGEWMGIHVFLNKGGVLEKSTNYNTLNNAVGWWNKILVEDIDNDGDMDIIAGNLGLNYKFHASNEKPFKVYTTDFDFNGTQDIILAKEYKGEEVPVRGKTCMTQQIPDLAKKIPSYNDFANKNLEGILGNALNTALNYKATEFRSGIFINNGSDGFTFEPFENRIQISPINSMVYDDIDGDGIKDLLLAGNNYVSEVETTRADAGIGAFLKGDSQNKFEFISNKDLGLFIDKDVRDMTVIKTKKGKIVFVTNNNSEHDMLEVNCNLQFR